MFFTTSIQVALTIQTKVVVPRICTHITCGNMFLLHTLCDYIALQLALG